jgi:hypothetical protein
LVVTVVRGSAPRQLDPCDGDRPIVELLVALLDAPLRLLQRLSQIVVDAAHLQNYCSALGRPALRAAGLA